MAQTWTFAWYAPGNVPLSPYYYMVRGLPIPAAPVPFLLSDASNGLSVRFRSLLGAYSPTYVPVNQNIPFTPGSHHKFTNVEETEVDVRLLIQADSRELLWSKINKVAYIMPAKPTSLYPAQPSMAYLFNPLHGPGVLQVTNPAGVTRNLNCRCISGFKIDPSTLQDKSVEVSLTFYANDPYWYSYEWNQVTVNLVQADINTLIPFQMPLLPLGVYRQPIVVGGVTEIVTRTNIFNQGDVNAYIQAYLNGPYYQPILTNTTIPVTPPPGLANTQINALSATANGGLVTLPTSQQSANFDFTMKSVTQASNQVNRISTLTTASNFWPLIPGENVVQCGILLPGTAAQQNIIFESQQPAITYFWQDAYSTVM